MEPTSLKPGTRIGHYVIERFVAIGGSAVVYQARDPRAGRHLAIKLLLDGRQADRDRARRFFREAHSYTRLLHPRIVTLYEVGEFEEIPFLAMEWVEGRTLAEYLEKGALQPGEIHRIMGQLADGLSAAHAVGLVHRDIKPANIMLTTEGDVKLLDFGLAQELSEQSGLPRSGITSDDVIVGTPAYMAPEQVHGKETSAASDVFSFGAVLYETLSGQQAFARPSQFETLNAVSAGKRQALSRFGSRLGRALQQLAERCLEIDPAKRPQDARELVVELAHLSGRRKPATLFSRRNLPLMTVGAVGIFLLGILVHQLIGSRTDPPSPTKGARVLPIDGNLPLLRPDGGGILYCSPDHREIWLSPVGTRNPQLIWAGRNRISGLCLAPDGQSVLFSSAEGAGPQWIQEVPISGGLPRKITKGRAPAVSRNGKLIASLLDLSSQKHQLILSGRDGSAQRVLHNFEDSTYPLSCAFSSSDASILISLTDSIRFSSLLQVNIQKGDTRLITRISGVARKGLNLSDPLQLVLWPIQGTLWATMIATGNSRPVYPGAGLASYPSMTADGRRLLLDVKCIEHELVEVDASPTVKYPVSKLRVLPGTRGGSQPRVSPDGRMLVFESARDDLWIMDLKTGSLGPLLTTGEASYNPAWSPDGKSVAYSCLKEHRSALWIAGADGSNPRRVTRDDWNCFQPSWHPDGRHILFVSDRDGPDNLYLLDLESGEFRCLGLDGAVNPALSPDGIHVAWVKPGESSGAHLCLGKFDKNLKKLKILWQMPVIVNHWAGSKPRFSPNGRRIAFDQPSGPVGADIWALPVDRKAGDHPYRLTAFESPVSLISWFDWAPDGKLIVTLSRQPESFLLLEDADLWIRQAMR